MATSFKSLGLSEPALEAVRRARFQHPTPIQKRVIPLVLEGKDVLGGAATGTGKTAAFVLPLVDRFAGQRGTLGLILAPTRELVEQIAQEVRFFGEGRGVTHAVVIGGVGAGQQRSALSEQPTFVIATPGRLVELLQSHSLDLGALRALVIDEADRMLDMGFAPQLQTVLRALPKRRQTLLFSATLGRTLTDFADLALQHAERVEVTRSGTPAEGAKQRLFVVEPQEKYALLLALLAEDQLATLIFSSTRERTEKVKGTLKREGYKAAAIHSERTQGQRRQALEGFRNGQYRCLVATEVAARGLDIDDVGHVINFDLPHSPEDYVHRIGRTARAGATGKASTFVTHEDSRFVSRIEKVMHRDLQELPVPRQHPAFVAELARFAEVKEASDARHRGRKPGRTAPRGPKHRRR